MSDVSLVTDLKAELAQVRSAKTAALTNGQEHSLNGSHSIKGVDYSALVRREAEIMSALALLNGASTYTVPDFSGGVNTKLSDL